MNWMFILSQWDNNMFGWFKKKGPTVEERLALLEATLEEERAAKETAESELEAAKTELTILREQADQYEDKRNSPEPWVEVIGESIDPVRGIEIRLDWNDAFVQYLKENGITAKSDEAAVQKWLAFLYQDLVEKFEQQIINNSDRNIGHDYI